MRRRYIVVYLSAFVVGFLLFIPAIQGVSPAYSGQLYSLYGDWLQGKPVGLAVFNVEPMVNGKEFKGDLILTIINYSSDPPKVVLVKHINGYSQVAFKIQRIPLRVQTTSEVQNGKIITKERTVFKDRSYYIGIVGVINDKLYSGGMFINFEPKQPISNLQIPIKLNEKTLTKEEISKMKAYMLKFKERGMGNQQDIAIKDGIIYTPSPINVEYSSTVLPAGVIHAAPWTKVKWCLESGISTNRPTGLWYDSFYQYVIAGLNPDPHSWEKGGKKIALANSNSSVTLDNTYSSQYKKKIVKAKVEYKLDTYIIGTSWFITTEYVLVPKYIYNLVNGPTSVENPPTVPSAYGTITNDPQTLNFIVNKNGEKWMVQSVTLTFGVGYDSVDADVSITLYRAAGDDNAVPPYLKVYNGKGLKYWYKDHRKDTYEVYFHW